MNGQLNREDIDRIITHFGIEGLVSALPQHEVCEALELVCLKDLSEELDVGYDKFRSLMAAGVIPYPQVRLLRRAYFREEEADTIRKKLRCSKKRKDLAKKPK